MAKGEMHPWDAGELRLRGVEHPLFRFASDIFTVLEADGTICYESPAIEEVLGYRPEDLIGKNAFGYVHPEDLERVSAAFAEAIADPASTRRVEFRFRHADGSWRYLEGAGINLIDEPDIGGVLVASRDIEGRKRAEEALKESEERYRAVVEQSMDGIYLLDAESRRLLETNPALQKMLGYEAEELRGMELYGIMAHPREDVDANLDRTLAERSRFVGERRYRRKDSSILEVEVGVNVIRFGGKEVVCAILRDVTERRRTEEALREAEARFRTLVEQVPAIIYIEELSRNGKKLSYISPQYEAMLGHSPQEGVSHPEHWLRIVHPDDRERVLAEDVRTDETGEPFVTEYRMFAADGSVVWIRDEALVVRDEEGRPLFWQGVMLDVTDRKLVEQRLRAAEEKYRTLVERMPAVTYIQEVGHTSSSFYVSPQIEDLLGYIPEDFTGDPDHWHKILHPDDRERVLFEAARTNETGEPFSMEYRQIAKEGSVIWIRDEAALVRGEEGQPEYWIGVQIDITERKEAEQALQGSEARFRSVVESVGEGLLITDDRDVVLYANPRMTELTGYSEEEMLERPAYELLLPPEEWPDLLERNSRRVKGGAPERYEMRLKRRDGGTFWAEINATPYRDASGEIVGTLGAFTDITERKRTERSLEESEQRFRQLFEQSVDALFVHDERGRFVDCNSQATLLLGYSREELLSISVSDISLDMLTPEARVQKKREGGTLWQRALDGAPGTFALSHEEENRRKDGTVFPVEVRVGSVDYGGKRMLLTSVRDITERRQGEEELRKSEERHRRQAQELSLLYRMSTALAREFDLSAIFRTVVEAVAESFGYTQVSAYQLVGADLVLQHQVGYDKVIERIPIEEGVMGRSARSGQPLLVEDVGKDPGFLGAIDDITSEVCVPLFDQNRVVGILNVESVGGVALTQADMRLTSALGEQASIALSRARLYSQAEESKERLAYQAFHDPLTGLANRSLLMDRLEHAQARARRRTDSLAVLFMDLDDFKVINDSLGHVVGDRLLVGVAERLSSCVRPQDTVARLGGDEFVALLEDLGDEGDAVRVAERIIEELRIPFAVDGNTLHTSASLGIAFDSASGEDLLRAADTAMYRAKARGKGRYEIFEQDMHHRAVQRLRLENDLRAALHVGGLAVYYQPKVNLHTGEVAGVEALLRWQHPALGMLLPKDFLPLAEQTGLIVPIGKWVLREACRRARKWRKSRRGQAPLLVCVNLSVKQLGQTDFVAEVLEETGLAPADLMLEITEDTVMEDAQYAISALEDLKRMGVKLAIDDFGTGHSSLSYLKRLPVDYLKIDRSFIERLGEDTKEAEIVSSTLALARALGLKAIAEGVETTAQLDRLKKMGCDLAQGNLFSAPLDADSLERFLGVG